MPALSPAETLRLIAAYNCSLNKGTKKSEPIRTTIILNGGSSVSGYINGIRDEGESTCLFMVEHDELRSVNLIYLPLWAITALKVHDAEQLLHLLSGGKIEVQQSAPNIMALRRKIADEVVRLRAVVQTDIKLEVSWETISQDELSLLGLFELIDSVMAVIHELIADEFKRIAFRTQINVVRFQNSKEAELIIDEQILIVKSELKAREEGRFAHDELLEAIASIL